MAVFPEHEKMPPELERDLLSRSAVTKDTGHAAHARRWGGRKSRRRVVTWELPVHLEASVWLFIHRNTSQLQHQQPSFSLGTQTGQRPRDPPQGLCLLRVDEDGQVGMRRLRPDLHLTRVSELLRCPREAGRGLRLAAARGRGWLPLGPGQIEQCSCLP